VNLAPSRLAGIAIRLVIALAEESAPCKAASLVAALGVAPATLRVAVQALARDGIVASRPGANGGYWLARPAAEISLGDVLEALDGPLATGVCILRDGPCQLAEVCPLHEAWASAQEGFVAALAEVDLAGVLQRDRALAGGEHASGGGAPGTGRTRR
jgi:Rrf2 family iron-sulfur cluster assembly transcriptional regulator